MIEIIVFLFYFHETTIINRRTVTNFFLLRKSRFGLNNKVSILEVFLTEPKRKIISVLYYLREGIFVVFINFRVGEKQAYWKLLPLCAETLLSKRKTLTSTILLPFSCIHILYVQDLLCLPV